jgi:hypothetical protein
MEAKDLSCWKCGASLEGVPMPISRLSECLSCRAELHVCRLCEFYDTKAAQACREPLAEEVKDKTRANFCEHFYPRPGVSTAAAPSSRTPSSELAALFGEGPATDPGTDAVKGEEKEAPSRNPLDDLFR